MIDKELWYKVLAFDLNEPFSEYCFSVRLARENAWTATFTAAAIVEYKKFMYLAATSDMMVSPSAIIDTVWHQHLIFTKSYSDLCELLGKNVQHVPSTHNREDFEKFRQAKERTRELYLKTFGEQPAGIWEHADMLDQLALPKANLKIRSFSLYGVLILIFVVPVAYLLLLPVYTHIDNPGFVIGFICLTVLAFIILEAWNRRTLRMIVDSVDVSSFIYQLQPPELVYLKTQNIAAVVHGSINKLIEAGLILINKDRSLELSSYRKADTLEELTIMQPFKEYGALFYPALLRQVVTKPYFNSIAHSMNALQKYIIKSRVFGKLYYTNFCVLGLILLLGLTRVFTGLERDKAVVFIGFLMLILTIVTVFYLNRLTLLFATHTIPELYREKIVPANPESSSWDWQYFLLGTAVLSSSFIPVVRYVEKNPTSGSSGSCGSSCGSSCSSCGGCGGGD